MLVNAAKEAAAKKMEDETRVEMSAAKTLGQMKRQEMEQQVKILTLEKELNNARMVLSTMRKVGRATHARATPVATLLTGARCGSGDLDTRT